MDRQYISLGRIALLSFFFVGVFFFLMHYLIAASQARHQKLLAQRLIPTSTPTPTSSPTPLPTAIPTLTTAPTSMPTNSVGSDSSNTTSTNSPEDTVWDRLADCESHKQWTDNTGNGYYGGLQFSQGAWESVGGTGRPSDASKDEQIMRGKMLQAARGWGPWGACSRSLGLL